MNPLFYGDPDHDNGSLIAEFVKELPTLKHQGYKTLFLEFLLEEPPLERENLKEQFIKCSAGKYGIAEAYVGLVEKARALGFEVWGLEQADYYPKSRSPQSRAYFAFRQLGGFDAVAAEIIRQRATSANNYVVRLGAAHWPLLAPRLPGLTCAAYKDEEVLPKDAYGDHNYAQAMVWQADYLYQLVNRALKVRLEGGLSVPNFGTRRAIGAAYADSTEKIAALWQDQEGYAPDLDRMAAIRLVYARREMPALVLKPAPVLKT